ncbi:MAG: hypothetical protein J7467_08890, partial [Chloroflexus sp.]|nr:hypothetical protein [Chloroflexus sp.]
MVEPSGHCPYLGLKQNQAIRFASPTPEHRCYAAGQAQEIPLFEPDYQVRYCLSTNHVRCPLYTGMPLPTTSPTALQPAGMSPTVVSSPLPSSSPSGLRVWLAGLAPRDRLIYTILLSVAVLALIGYALGGVAYVSTMLNSAGAPTATIAVDVTISSLSPTRAEPESFATASPTMIASPTPTMTLSPTATPYELIPVTNTPTVPIFVPPPPPPQSLPTPTATVFVELPTEL